MTMVGFDKLFVTTGEHWFTGPEKFINDAARKRYATLSWANRGQDPEVVVRRSGGQNITDYTMLAITSQAEWTDVSTSGSGAITEAGVQHTVHWRLAKRPLVWDEYVESKNNNASVGAGGGAQQFKRYAKTKFIELETDIANLQEDAYWAVSNVAQMETGTTTGLLPHSILNHINEYSNGLPTSIFPGGAWSQFQGIASTEPGFSNYVPYQRSYKNMTVNDLDNVIVALDYAFEELKVQPPPTKQEYFESSEMAPPATVMFTDITGKVRLKNLCRASQDRWEDPTDAYFGAPTYGGIPVVCPTPLETVQAFPTGTAGALGTMQTTTNNKGGSRFFLVNFEYFKTIYDADWFMKAIDVGREQNRATRHMIWYYLGLNNFNLSPRRHACIYPANNIA